MLFAYREIAVFEIDSMNVHPKISITLQESSIEELHVAMKENQEALLDAEERLKAKLQYITELEEKGNANTCVEAVCAHTVTVNGDQHCDDSGLSLTSNHSSTRSLTEKPIMGTRQLQVNPRGSSRSPQKKARLESHSEDETLSASRVEPVASSTILSPVPAVLPGKDKSKSKNLFRKFLGGRMKKSEKKKDANITVSKTKMPATPGVTRRGPLVQIQPPSPPHGPLNRSKLNPSTQFTAPSPGGETYRFFAKRTPNQKQSPHEHKIKKRSSTSKAGKPIWK